jgi:hypothetical protein
MARSSEIFLTKQHPFDMTLHQVKRMLHQSITPTRLTEMHPELSTTSRLGLCRHDSGDDTSHERRRG